MDKQQLASQIWKAANKMRGALDANDYKDFILGFMFYKFLSEKEEQFFTRRKLPREMFSDYLASDNSKAVNAAHKNLGYFIEHDDLFSTWVAHGDDLTVGHVVTGLNHFENQVTADYKHVFDGIFDSFSTSIGKLGNDAAAQSKRLREIIDVVVRLPKGNEEAYDVLGYVYEYLIGQFAANAGKKAGEFYTPHQVALVMAELVAEHVGDRGQIDTYDPTAGSGSLLLNIGSQIEKRTGKSDQVKYFAQELKAETYNLTRMNLVMRGVDPNNIVTRNADSLDGDWPEIDQYGRREPLRVDAVVSNPPYSAEWDPKAAEGDPRFDYGLAPKRKADYAFLLHELYHLKDDGILTIVLPHGVLFRGGDEEEIRKNLIDKNHIETIIGFPPNIFYGTGIATIVMVLKKNRTQTDVLFVDASREFVKAGKKNELRAQDVRRIVDTVTARDDVEHYARVVSRDEIIANGYNLNIPRYIDVGTRNETWDIYATMFGGIPNAEIDELEKYWSALPGLRNALFEQGASSEHSSVKADDVAAAVGDHESVSRLWDSFHEALEGFDGSIIDTLLTDVENTAANMVEAQLRHELFERLSSVPVIDDYAVYQVFADAWEVTSGDVDFIVRDGFDAVRGVDPNMVIKKDSKTNKDKEVQEGWLGRILPFELVQREFFPEEVEQLRELNEQLASTVARKDELFGEVDEEYYGEEDDAITNAGKTGFKKTGVTKRIKEMKGDDALTDEEQALLDVLVEANSVLARETKLKKQIKTIHEDLHEATKTWIETCTEEDARYLLEIKWAYDPVAAMDAVLEREVAALSEAVEKLRDKYAVTLGEVEETIASSSETLVDMMGQLRGGENDMAGLEALTSMLEGEK